MQKIYTMIENELAHHPASRLTDIYKLFMQSACGPGHLIPDTATAREYLLKELAVKRQYISRFPKSNHPYIKGLKPQHIIDNTCPCLLLDCNAFFPLARYSLQIVNDGIIPMETFLSAFIETANNFTKIDQEQFSQHWQAILVYLQDRSIPNFIADKLAIDKIIYNLVSHTALYNEQYHPSYRIINKTYLADFEKAITDHYFQ